MVNLLPLVAVALLTVVASQQVNYFGHKVLTIYPKSDDDLALLKNLRSNYGLDFWNEINVVGIPVMVHVKPDIMQALMDLLRNRNVAFETSIEDLGSLIFSERIQNSVSSPTQEATGFDFGKYHHHDEILPFIQGLAKDYPNIVKLETIGSTYENRAIYDLKITSGQSGTKPAIMMECGIHAREWSSVSTGLYIINEIITKYGSDPVITTLVDQYEFHIIPEANPDGYLYTWTQDRMWRKTRSRSQVDWLGVCPGADANRNFDIEHCGVGTSRKPCDDIYCGDSPFSESETRALRDLMIKLKDRMKLYISIHAFSQLWMTPYGTGKHLPPNYAELVRIGKAGVSALSRRYGTVYKLGSIANIIYEAAGSSVDYAYQKLNITKAFALELRDTGRYGFFLPNHLIKPTAEETWDGIQASILAL